MSSEIRITPSILNADLDNLNHEIERISKVSDYLHLDVMDDVFVPNFTFDFSRASEIIKSSPLAVDAHLMVSNVDSIAVQYAEAGAASVTVHVEAVSNIRSTLKNIRSQGSRAAIALKPATDVSAYSEFIDEVDMFLIMTVEPGFGGQKFMTEMMEKVRRTRSMIGARPIWLQVDGGISLETIEIAREAGADTFVAGSAVFNSDDPAEMVNLLRAKASSTKLEP
ncbi:MAG: ribulose-phosphate 3-epimerase [Actinobacteria bacterium]|uniref:ribulose-phosphate 3-epimerase n=1 Tax=freshwater metagenome TaxID=449393 RepID=A0A6J7B3R0_9ZZZZ|nr:ribulose-phosphate 3-epimerase [Actinomycetota bacterium]MSX59842.1 ribulose-phosphate 3-epimerase [Actinomycetota bacterium]